MLATSHRSYVVYALILVNVLVHAYLTWVGDAEATALRWQFGFIPSEITRGESLGLVGIGTGSGETHPVDIGSPIPDWATGLTAMFLHGNLLHLLGNMLFLFGFGRLLAERTGELRFAGLYLAFGMAAFAVQVAFNPTSQIATIGASGAIAGVMGAFFVMRPSRSMMLLIVLVMYAGPAVIGAFGLFGGIAYSAHTGGLLAGVVLGWVMKRRNAGLEHVDNVGSEGEHDRSGD